MHNHSIGNFMMKYFWMLKVGNKIMKLKLL